MALTNAQLAALRAGIQAETGQSIVAARQNGADNVIVAWCNGASSTIAWNYRADGNALFGAMDMSKYNNLAAANRDSWSFFVNRADRTPLDVGKAATRKAITDIWGNATAGSDAEKLLQGLTETATRGQVYVGGTARSTGTVSALDRSYTGAFSDDDIAKARGAGW